MKTLFVAWQQQNNRGWYPVGRLDADVSADYYRFRYLQGAIEAAEQCGFVPFDSFPDIEGDSVSSELFPFFANRLQNSSQPGFREYLRRLDLATDDGETFDPIEVLAVSEGRRATDNLEIFPRVTRTEGRPFTIKFFLHGWRYLPADRAQRVLSVRAGDNILRCAIPVSAVVSRVNLPPAPPSQRLLVSFDACWPDDYEPMSGDQFEVLVGDDSPVREEALVAS